MEVMEIIDMMEDVVEKATGIWLTGHIIIDKEELLDYLQEIRLALPDELKQAKWVKEERQRILSEADKEAQSIVKGAQEKIVQLINEHEITTKAQEHAENMMENAHRATQEMREDSIQYADAMLSDVERRLEALLTKVKMDKEGLHK